MLVFNINRMQIIKESDINKVVFNILFGFTYLMSISKVCVCAVIFPYVIHAFYTTYSSGQGLYSLSWHNFITLGTLTVLL